MTILTTLFVIANFVFLLPKPIFALENSNLSSNQFINIVNPVRISTYSTNPKASLEAQYLEIRKRNLAATWLLTYDVISTPAVIEVVKVMDRSQEIGLFLEVTPELSSAAEVSYNKTDSWHRASSIFLSGYTQEDRIKLIDKIFEKYKEIFGTYPKSVGAWWIDSYSLNYMKQKYDISGSLTVADQFSTDGYQVWGQYWSTPFYPSKFHAGMPASSLDNKLDIVTIQWAARDPLNGYGRGKESLYSTQDYFTINLSDNYFKNLVELYALKHSNSFGHIILGLEGDLTPNAYGGIFARQLDIIKDQESTGSVNILTMRDFSSWYRGNFPKLSPVQMIQANDFLGKKIKSIWYQSPNFRINILYNYDTKESKVRDLRTYHNNFQEPYFIAPIRDLDLSINLPSLIDSASNPSEEWIILKEELMNIDAKNEELVLNYTNNYQIKLTSQSLEIKGDIKNPPKLVVNSALVSIKRLPGELSIKPKKEWNFPQQGLVFRALTQEGSFFLKQRKILAAEILGSIILAGLTILIWRKRMPKSYKLAIIGIFILILGEFGYRWYLSNSKLYFVNQSELDALNRLKSMSGKRVIVYDKVCLQCSWHTMYIPSIFANKRDYVGKVSGKLVVYNSSIFNAKTRPEAKKELNKLSADYIYVARFEDYKELIPFSPGDLNIEEIYSNANAQIWRVRKN